MVVNMWGVLCAYLFVVLAFVVLVVGRLLAGDGMTVPWAIGYGALVGLALYGIYNATNAAIFSGYDIRVAVTDTMWGVLLFSVASGVFAWMVGRRDP
jgi:uncharacterized membrane protein